MNFDRIYKLFYCSSNERVQFAIQLGKKCQQTLVVLHQIQPFIVADNSFQNLMGPSYRLKMRLNAKQQLKY